MSKSEGLNSISDNAALTKEYLTITRMKEEHVEQLVEVHLESFKGFFLSFLGKDFLKLFYLGACRDSTAIGLVALSKKGEVIGFAVGALNPAGFYSSLLKRDWWRFSMASFGAVMKKPAIIPRLARALLYPSTSPTGNDVALFMSLGVSIRQAAKAYSSFIKELRATGAKDISEVQYHGAGRELVAAFISEASRRGAKKVFLHVDKGNLNVIKLHESLGAHRFREFVTPEGRHMYEYVRELDRKPK